ncbi:MAG: MFS transporter [Clostridia bacterium]|nr:MFS transporter [Clostridia bacterium]
MLSIFKHKIKHLGSLEKNSLLFTFEGIIGAIIINLVNPFISMFGKRMGAGDFQIGLLSSLPSLISIIALIPGALIVDRAQDKKKIVGTLAVVYGIMYSLAALTPFMGKYQIPVYILIIALMNWPFSVFNISWQSFFSDVFSTRDRSSVYAKRSRASSLIGMITVLVGGLILAYIPHNDSQRLVIYQAFFAAAFGLCLLQRWFLSRVSDYNVTEPDTKTKYMESLLESIKSLAVNTQFKAFTLISFIFHITWQMAWPLFFIYQANYLHANEAWLSYITVGFGLSGVLTYSLWNRVIAKKGAKWVVIIGALGLTLNPFLVIASKSLFMVLLVNIITGLTFSGFQLALFENLLEVVPQENKTLNIAVYTTFINISGFVAPMLGVAIYKMTSMYFVLLLAGGLRLAATSLFYVRYRRYRRVA